MSKIFRLIREYIRYLQSFMNLHKMCNRATPDGILEYKLALSLHKLYNKIFNSIEFIQMNFNQIFTSRQTSFKILKSNHFRVGLNSLSNRLSIWNNEMFQAWLNFSIDTFKIHCKKLYLSYIVDCRGSSQLGDPCEGGPPRV